MHPTLTKQQNRSPFPQFILQKLHTTKKYEKKGIGREHKIIPMHLLLNYEG